MRRATDRMAEGEGFEPPVPRKRDNGFQNRRFRPLSHPSVLSDPLSMHALLPIIRRVRYCPCYWEQAGKKHGRSLRTKYQRVAEEYLKKFEYRLSQRQLGQQTDIALQQVKDQYPSYSKGTKKQSSYELCLPKTSSGLLPLDLRQTASILFRANLCKVICFGEQKTSSLR